MKNLLFFLLLSSTYCSAQMTTKFKEEHTFKTFKMMLRAERTNWEWEDLELEQLPYVIVHYVNGKTIESSIRKFSIVNGRTKKVSAWYYIPLQGNLNSDGVLKFFSSDNQDIIADLQLAHRQIGNLKYFELYVIYKNFQVCYKFYDQDIVEIKK